MKTTIPGMERGIEWGAGRSTIWLASRLSSLVTIEEDPAWYEKVKSDLGASGATKVQLVLAPAKDVDHDDDSEAGRERRAKYVNAGGLAAEGTIDFALVDGCLRVDCCLRAIELLAPGGILALDDSQRYLPIGSPSAKALDSASAARSWAEFANRVAGWESTHLTDGVSTFSVWRRPGERHLPAIRGDRVGSRT